MCGMYAHAVQVMVMFEAIAELLASLHGNGRVHRDVRPRSDTCPVSDSITRVLLPTCYTATQAQCLKTTQSNVSCYCALIHLERLCRSSLIIYCTSQTAQSGG